MNNILLHFMCTARQDLVANFSVSHQLGFCKTFLFNWQLLFACFTVLNSSANDLNKVIYLFVYLFICTTLLFKYKQQQQQFKADLHVGVTIVSISLKLLHEFPQDANNTARD